MQRTSQGPRLRETNSVFSRVGVLQLDKLLEETPCTRQKVTSWKLSKLNSEKGNKGDRKQELSTACQETATVKRAALEIH